MKSISGNGDHNWAFVTNYAHVLVRVAADPGARLRDIAEAVGVTERTAAELVKDLERAGYLTKTRRGRRNQYEIHDDLPLRHPQHRHHTVGELIRFLGGASDSRVKPTVADQLIGDCRASPEEHCASMCVSSDS